MSGVERAPGKFGVNKKAMQYERGQLIVTDFETLDADTRCHALVGQFLQAWSAMELSLRDAIGAALKIEPVKLQIIYANLRFRDKINILRTLIDISSLPEDCGVRAKSKLRKIANHARKRNMIAHAPFGPDATETGVAFLTVKASGTFETPNIVWSPRQFAQEITLLGGYTKVIDDIRRRFEEQPLPETSYAKALHPFIQTDWPVPMRRTISPALIQSVFQPPPHTLRDSDEKPASE
jgi:hypothetical protein